MASYNVYVTNILQDNRHIRVAKTFDMINKYRERDRITIVITLGWEFIIEIVSEYPMKGLGRISTRAVENNFDGCVQMIIRLTDMFLEFIFDDIMTNIFKGQRYWAPRQTRYRDKTSGAVNWKEIPKRPPLPSFLICFFVKIHLLDYQDLGMGRGLPEIESLGSDLSLQPGIHVR